MKNSKEISQELKNQGITNELTILSNFSDYAIRLYFVTEREFISIKDRFDAKFLRVV